MRATNPPGPGLNSGYCLNKRTQIFHSLGWLVLSKVKCIHVQEKLRAATQTVMTSVVVGEALLPSLCPTTVRTENGLAGSYLSNTDNETE